MTRERKKIRIAENEPTLGEVKFRMADAITNVFSKKQYYDQLSDDEVFGYGEVLWAYFQDLREEFDRREFLKASHTWAASTENWRKEEG